MNNPSPAHELAGDIAIAAELASITAERLISGQASAVEEVLLDDLLDVLADFAAWLQVGLFGSHTRAASTCASRCGKADEYCTAAAPMTVVSAVLR